MVSGCESQSQFRSANPPASFSLGLIFIGKEEISTQEYYSTVRQGIPATQHPFPLRAPLACSKQTRLTLREDSVSLRLMQSVPAETAERRGAVNQHHSPGSREVQLHRGNTDQGVQFEYTEKRTELSTGPKLCKSIPSVPMKNQYKKASATQLPTPACSVIIPPCRHAHGLCQHWMISFLLYFSPIVASCYSVSCAFLYFNHIWLPFCPQNQTTRCLLQASNSHW